jgi:predicted nucleic acid-binding Zn ribbon protein
VKPYRTVKIVKAFRPTRRGSGWLGRAGHAADAWLGSQDLMLALRPHMAKVYWNEIVGEQIAAVTQVHSVIDGILTVRVKNSAWCQELTLLREDVLRRLNLKLGGYVLQDIKFKGEGLYPVTPEPVPIGPVLPKNDEIDGMLPSPEAITRADQKVQGIADPVLRERLRATLLRVARLEDWKRDQGWLPCPYCGTLTSPESCLWEEPLCTVCRTYVRYPDRRQQRDSL